MADDEAVPHAFHSRTPYEPGDARDIWCRDCEYHREHVIHQSGRARPVVVTADPPFTAGCTEPEFPAWWEHFGKALATDRRLSGEMRALAAFSAGWLRAGIEREEIGKLNTLATEEWADKIACQQELETLRADVARLRHLAHQLDIMADDLMKPLATSDPYTAATINQTRYAIGKRLVALRKATNAD